jgi:hypothetical protein
MNTAHFVNFTMSEGTTVLNGQVLFAIFAISKMFPCRFHKARKLNTILGTKSSQFPFIRCRSFTCSLRHREIDKMCCVYHRCQPLRFFRNCYEFRAKITVLRSTVYLLRISDYCRPETVLGIKQEMDRSFSTIDSPENP